MTKKITFSLHLLHVEIQIAVVAVELAAARLPLGVVASFGLAV